jgi:hypothetical protein
MADDEDTEPEECQEDGCRHDAHPKKGGRCKCCAEVERNITEYGESRSKMKHFRSGERYAYERVAELLGFNWHEKAKLQTLVCKGDYDY